MSPCLDIPTVSVIVLAFDERESVEATLTELIAWLREHEPNAEIIFVDDGSRDGTAALAEAALASWPRSEIVLRGQNGGMGAAIKDGARAASGEWLTFLPADGQVPPVAVGRLMRSARGGGVEMVLSVYEDRDDGLHRRLLSGGVRALIALAHGVRIRSEGPYLIRRKIFLPEQIPPDSFFLNFELPVRALAAGIRAGEVEVPCRPRRAGTSKSFALAKIAHVGRDLFALRLRRVGDLARLWGL